MANVFNLLKEALTDNEPNENIEATLGKMLLSLNNTTEYFLSEYSKNLQFMLLMVERAIDKRSPNVNETELRLRAKLMSKYMIRDCFVYYLHLLANIIDMCCRRNLNFRKINAIMEILHQENVITPFVYSHWHCSVSDPHNFNEDAIVHHRFNTINMCINFLNKMEEPHDPHA